MGTSTEKRTKSTAYMPADETREMCSRAQAGDMAARNAVIEGHMGLVESVASSYTGRGIPFEDLTQEGVIGLMHAIRKYQHQKAAFSTYATYWIRQRISRAIMEDGTIRVPVYVHTRTSSERRGTVRAPGTPLVSQFTKDAAAQVAHVASLDEPQRGDDGYSGEWMTLGATIPDPAQDTEGDALDCVEIEENARLVAGLLACLTPREQTLIRLRFGMGCEVHSLQAAGGRLGITRQRTQQIEATALRKLRDRAGVHIGLAALMRSAAA